MIRTGSGRIAGVAAIGALLMMTGIPAHAVEPSIDKTKLEKMARDASTPAQHAAVAREYRLWAEELDAKAVKHEEEAKKLAKRPLPAMAHKWPAMVSRPADKEKQLAIQMRRAAEEARAVSARHLSLAVELSVAE